MAECTVWVELEDRKVRVVVSMRRDPDSGNIIAEADVAFQKFGADERIHQVLPHKVTVTP